MAYIIRDGQVIEYWDKHFWIVIYNSWNRIKMKKRNSMHLFMTTFHWMSLRHRCQKKSYLVSSIAPAFGLVSYQVTLPTEMRVYSFLELKHSIILGTSIMNCLQSKLPAQIPANVVPLMVRYQVIGSIGIQLWSLIMNGSLNICHKRPSGKFC
jgi:hypothetical protein